MSDDITRVWRELNDQKERVIKLESRTEQNERQLQQQYIHMNKIETDLKSDLKEIRTEQQEMFQFLKDAISSITQSKSEEVGFKQGEEAARQRMVKQLKIWLGVPSAILAVLGIAGFIINGG